jgi:hypothetical protein
VLIQTSRQAIEAKESLCPLRDWRCVCSESSDEMTREMIVVAWKIGGADSVYKVPLTLSES